MRILQAFRKPAVKESMKDTGQPSSGAGARGQDPQAKPASLPQEQPKKKHPGGRPSKLTKKKIKTAEELSANGKIDKDIAAMLKIAERSLYRYASKNAEFCQALKRGKKIADDKAEAALYSRTIGYEYIEQNIELGHDKEGKIYVKDLRITKKTLPPDVLACQTWLNNRRPEAWRQKIPELSNIADSLGSVLELIRKHEEKKARSV